MISAGVSESPTSGVAHFFSRLEPGGAELRTIELVTKVGETFDFVATSGLEGELDQELRSSGHGVHLARMNMRNVGAYVGLMRSRNLTVVHSHLGAASGLILLAAWIARVPRRIAHFRSDGIGGRSSVFKSIQVSISRALVQIFATHIVGVSPGSLKYGWRKRWQLDTRCQVIPNGFDVEDLRSGASIGEIERVGTSDQQLLVIVNVGRSDPVKNRGRAIQIWSDMTATRSSLLRLVGSLNDTDRLQAVGLSSTSPQSRIDIVGESRSVPRYLGGADVLLATSTREGLPGVVLEALAVGTPVVASSLPGTKWIAEFLPGIELCSLSDDNSSWISATERALDMDSSSIMAAFDQSPFTIEHSVDAFSRLWGLKP